MCRELAEQLPFCCRVRMNAAACPQPFDGRVVVVIIQGIYPHQTTGTYNITSTDFPRDLESRHIENYDFNPEHLSFYSRRVTYSARIRPKTIRELHFNLMSEDFQLICFVPAISISFCRLAGLSQ